MSRKNKNNSHETIKLDIDGMTCTSCEKIISKEVSKIPGVLSVNASYNDSFCEVEFDRNKTNKKQIVKTIEKKGYIVLDESGDLKENKPKTNIFKILTIGLTIIIIMFALYQILSKFDALQLPEVGANASYALLFLIGILTGFHCIGMCGGFVVSYTAKNANDGKNGKYMQHFAYGSGKLISYAVIGGLFGLLGTVFQFSNTARVVIAIVAGLFLIIYGLNMLNIFKPLRRLQFRLPSVVPKTGNKGPFSIGLMNGLFIACGPLQAMYIYAMSTGSFTQGALSLAFFGLGTTIPLILFGVFATVISASLTKRILQLSGVIVIILGLVMLNRGLALSGSGYDANSLKERILSPTPQLAGPSDSGGTKNVANSPNIKMENGYQIIDMDVISSGYSPNKFVLKKGVPVKWRINGKQLTGCNNAIQVPKYGLEFKIKQGIQEIEFTPTETGVVPWSCWMGMIRGSFTVVDDVTDASAIAKQEAAAPSAPSGGSCGMGGGGCGCGG